MIAKRAESLSSWSLEDLEAGKYAPNVVVFFKPRNSEAGYAFKATHLFSLDHPKARLEPDKAQELWQIDNNYASEWKPDGRYSYWPLLDDLGLYQNYNFARRVYYFNGQTAYIYKTTPRYFGGQQPPNEEVDLDGYRTWEIDFEYQLAYYGENQDIFKVPVRYDNWSHPVFILKKVGNERDGVTINGATDDWEAGNINLDVIFQYPYNDLPTDQPVPETIPYKELTTVFESNPYDYFTYEFFEIFGFGVNGPFNRVFYNKGIHKAEIWKKQLDSGNVQINTSFIKRQFYFTNWSITYPSHHYSATGFSVEFWQDKNDADIEINIANLSKPSFDGLGDYFGWGCFVFGKNDTSFGFSAPRTTGWLNTVTYGPSDNPSTGQTFLGDPHPQKIVYVSLPSSTGSNGADKVHYLGRDITIKVLFVSQTFVWITRPKYKAVPIYDSAGNIVGYYEVQDGVYYEQKTLPSVKVVNSYSFKIDESSFTNPVEDEEVSPYYQIGVLDLSGFARQNTIVKAGIIAMELSD